MKRQFGDFEFDTSSRELRRHGQVVKLQAQPAQVLALLIEHAGEVVSRDAIRDAVWGQDTFVDFDKGLNFAIAQVRAALGDSADSPTFIKTFPKRGYQFVGSDTSDTSEVSDTSGTQRMVWIAIAIAIVAVATWFFTMRPSPAHTIAVLRFDNQTGSAEFDRYAQNLTDAVVAELTASGSGRFGIIGNAVALRTPREQRDIVAIGRQLNAGYIILGQVLREGDRVRILAHLIRLPEQTHLWVTRVERAPTDLVKPSELAQRISTEFLEKL